MSAGLTPHRWRLTGVGATDDEMRCFAAVTDPGGRTRRYTFVKEVIDEAANFTMWTTGDWDRERRPSEVRLDRVIVLDEAAIRREGAALDQAMFDRVVAAARHLHALD